MLQHGHVLVKFFCADCSTHHAGSGYSTGHAVLTVIPPTIGCQNDRLDSVLISCYSMDAKNTEFRVVSERRVWNLEIVDRMIDDLSKSDVTPYNGQTSCQSKTGNTQIRFALLTLKTENVEEIVYTTIRRLSENSKNVQLMLGQDLSIIYAPFGCNAFINSYSKGSLCNELRGAYIIEGRLAPGCEGAPVYTTYNVLHPFDPIGLVLFPIANGPYNSGYSLVVPFHIIAEEVFGNNPGPRSMMYSTRMDQPALIKSPLDFAFQEALQNTLMVEIPGAWGSGVAVAKGLAITNSHVVSFGRAKFVNVVWRNHTTVARVIFHSNPSNLLDIALLHYDENFGPSGIRISQESPKRGERVFVAGHPLKRLCNLPFINKGNVLNYWDNSVAFTTSCMAKGGSSGGPIVREDGTLLGILFSLFHVDNEPFPEITICMASSAFGHAIQTFMKTGDLTEMNSLLHIIDPWLDRVLNIPKCRH